MLVYTVPDLPEASPMIIAETETHVVIALEIRKTTLLRNIRFLETLIDAATRAPDEEPSAAVDAFGAG
jgi:hypothetical protein